MGFDDPDPLTAPFWTCPECGHRNEADNQLAPRVCAHCGAAADPPELPNVDDDRPYGVE